MSVTVKYFANLKELIGRDRDDIEYREGMTVADVWSQVKGEMNYSMGYLTAVNMEYAPEHTKIEDGDEVAFFPKVSGG